MYIRYENLAGYDAARGCNHFPVGQARCDGRTTLTSDKPSHCSSFPISDPVVHETADREYWNALYGMNTMKIGELIRFGRSWAYAPELTIHGNNFSSSGYDRTERCYQAENLSGKPGTFDLTLDGSKDSPVINPAIRIRNWNSEGATILVNGKPWSDCRTGINPELGGTDLIVFLSLNTENQTRLSIVPGLSK
jgi:hypothetical protein